MSNAAVRMLVDQYSSAVERASNFSYPPAQREAAHRELWDILHGAEVLLDQLTDLTPGEQDALVTLVEWWNTIKDLPPQRRMSYTMSFNRDPLQARAEQAYTTTQERIGR